MDYVKNKDLFIVSGASLISDVDFDVIIRLYQPIIGNKAAILYLTLVNYSYRDDNEGTMHETLFKLMQTTSSDFINARKILESIGLLKTYFKEDKEINSYNYVIYAPKSPVDFFKDTLFKGMLVKYIGVKEATKLALSYKNNISLGDYKDISTHFKDVFQPDLDDESFDVDMPSNLKDNKAIKVDTDFSFFDFFNHLKTAMMISEKAFSENELKEIERVATLYGLDTITTCEVVAQSFDESRPKGEKINFDVLSERAISQAKYSVINKKNDDKDKVYLKVSGKTKLADEINLMEVISPKRYLQLKQDNIPPVTADLNLLNYLNATIQLNKGVINALISYCLKMCDNRLNRNYVEKVAMSLKREKITTALDALNYLNNKNKKSSSIKKISKPVEVNNDKKEESFDVEEYNKLLDSITKRKK